MAQHGKQRVWPPKLTLAELEQLGDNVSYEPKYLQDRAAKLIVNTILEGAMHLFFREKYDHHACVLETVAAVPGSVAAFHRHFRSLRNMSRDYGWINPLMEESENERMHLLIWMQVTQPTPVERAFVLAAQFAYLSCYTTLYWLSPYTAHRTVGYLEECAVRAYNDYLAAIDSGAIANRPAPAIAKKYYRLADEATLRDVVLHVRGDECMHRDFNHMLGDKHSRGEIDEEPSHMSGDLRWEGDPLGFGAGQDADKARGAFDSEFDERFAKQFDEETDNRPRPPGKEKPAFF